MYDVARGKTGTVEGTGAAIFVNIGFIPRHVRLFNRDGNCSLEWTWDMGAGKGFKLDGGSVDNGFKVGFTFISSGGITVSNQYDSQIGFYIGTDSDLNVDGETIDYAVYGE